MASNILLLQRRDNRLARGLLENPEIKHVSVITEPGHIQRYSPDIDVRLVANAGDLEQVRRAALDVVREREIEFIVAPFEMTVTAAGFLRTYLGLPGMGYDTSIGFANKYIMKQKLAAAGLPVAAYDVAYSLSEVPAKAAKIGWPVVVKPALGWGSRDVGVLADLADFERFIASPAAAALAGLDVPLIVEELIDIEWEYHIDGIVHDGEVLFASTSAYFKPMLNSQDNLGSYFLAPDDPHAEELRRLHRETVAALGLRGGVTHMEVFLTDGGFRVGEIACRPGGGGVPDAIQMQHGVDMWDAFTKISLGLVPEARPTSRDGIVAHYYFPLRSGRITAMATPDRLAELDSVIRVDLRNKVGDVIGGDLTPTSTSGEVYFTVSAISEIPARMREIVSRYDLAVDGRPQQVELDLAAFGA